jgi:hypothetical protein
VAEPAGQRRYGRLAQAQTDVVGNVEDDHTGHRAPPLPCLRLDPVEAISGGNAVTASLIATVIVAAPATGGNPANVASGAMSGAGRD